MLGLEEVLMLGLVLVLEGALLVLVLGVVLEEVLLLFPPALVLALLASPRKNRRAPRTASIEEVPAVVVVIPLQKGRQAEPIQIRRARVVRAVLREQVWLGVARARAVGGGG